MISLQIDIKKINSKVISLEVEFDDGCQIGTTKASIEHKELYIPHAMDMICFRLKDRIRDKIIELTE